MTSPESGSPRPGRIAGVALLGLAAVALVIGLITALGGNGDDQAGGDNEPPATSSSTSSTATSGSSRPGTTSSRPPSSNTSSVPAPSTSTTTTTKTGQTPPSGDGNGEPTKTIPVRVYNNSTIKGLAARAADDLRADGWQVTDVSNYPFGIIPTTTVYYRPGTDEEAAAKQISAAFGMRTEARFDGIKDAPAGLIVIVTNDYGNADGGGKNEG
ncbi:LytR C-terminal domain-containing protein [Actinophytocola sp.]|uniref:LytR C-terminal domain-containing protein n=1 Tax=Actinophytocola sp. TaxID=1872138 RepID=UPI002ED30401